MFRLMSAVFRLTRRSILVIGCLFFFSINVLTLTSDMVFGALSNALEFLKIDTVSSKYEKSILRERKISTSLRKQNSKFFKAKGTARKLGGKVVSRTVAAATLNIASVPAEVIPFLGPAVIVSATIAELHMACDTISDINSLFEALDISPEEDPNIALETCYGYIDWIGNFKNKNP